MPCDDVSHIRLGPRPETQEELNARMDEAVHRISNALHEKEQTMAVRVKVVCNWKSENGQQLSFTPVYSGSEENEKFFAATPGGMFMFYTVNQDAAAQFQMGKEYYFDIFAAEPAQFRTQPKESTNG